VAEKRDVSLAPYFAAHARVGRGTADALVLPVIALVCRRGGDICGVYPIERDGRRYTVEDGLQALEAGEPVDNLETPA
jgi:hypothetical protein